MKTFGLFMFLWLVYILLTFNILKNVSSEEISKLILATLHAFIFYKLLKEELKEENE